MYSVRMRKNIDQENSEYGHFSRTDCLKFAYCKVKSENKVS